MRTVTSKRFLVPALITALFAFSTIASTGIVAAGGDHSHKPGVQGACVFNLETYALGDTMNVQYTGYNGATDGSGYFSCVLRNPSGWIVKYTSIVYGERTEGTLVYTLSPTDQTGTWTAQMTYTTGTRRAHVTVLGDDTAVVPGATVDRLTLVQTSYDPSAGLWTGVATLLDNAGAPIAGATVVLQYSGDGGVSWSNTRQGSEVTNSAGQAAMHTTGQIGTMLRVTYSTDNLVSNTVTMA